MYVTATVIQNVDGDNTMSFILWDSAFELSSALDQNLESVRIHPKLEYLVAQDVYVDITKDATRLVAGWHIDSEPVFVVIQKAQKDISTISIDLFTDELLADKRIEDAKQYIIDSGLTYTEQYGQLEYIQENTEDVWFIDIFVCEDNRLVPV